MAIGSALDFNQIFANGGKQFTQPINNPSTSNYGFGGGSSDGLDGIFQKYMQTQGPVGGGSSGGNMLSGLLGSLGGGIGSFLGNAGQQVVDNAGRVAAGAAGLAASNYAVNQGQNALQDIGTDMSNRFGISSQGSLGSQIANQAQFKPFTVTNNLGSSSYNNGMLNVNAGNNNLMNQANSMANNLGSSGLMPYAQNMQMMGNQMIGDSQQAQDLNLLRGGFANQAQQGLNMQQGSNQVQQLGQQAAQNVNFGQPAQNVSDLFSGITNPNVRSGAGGLANQAMSMGQGMLGQGSPDAQGIYDQIRAMQSPDEERQRLQLENRLASQGRLGVSTAMYGGTPEQFSMDKAQAEARNNASYQALQQSDQLANSQQQRAMQLSQLGLSAEQVQSQMDSEGFNRDLALGQAQLQTAQTQEGLQSSVQARQAQLAQLGMSAEQIQSQLQSEGLGRNAQSAQMAGQLAQTASGLQTEGINRGQGLFGLGLQAQQADGQFTGQNIQNIASMMQASGIPLEQQLAALQPSLQAQQMQQSGQLAQLSALSQLGTAELGMLKELGLGGATLDQEMLRTIGNIFAGAGRAV